MTSTLKDLNGFRALQADLFIPWNTPFGKVREILQQHQARDIEEHGMRNIRFEETVAGKLDLQYELYFSPDYGYGLRSATAEIEQIDGRAQMKDNQGSFRPLVDGYFQILEILKGHYGEPSFVGRTDVQDPEKLTHLLDHTRDHTGTVASWTGPATHISHELLVSFLPRHLLRFSTINSRLLIVNKTGKSGLLLNVGFPGGSAQANLGRGQERVVELPLSGEVSVGATLGQKTAELKVPIKGDRMTIEIHTNWITGRIRFKPLVPDSVA